MFPNYYGSRTKNFNFNFNDGVITTGNGVPKGRIGRTFFFINALLSIHIFQTLCIHLAFATNGFSSVNNQRNFYVDPTTGTFIKDGQPFRYVSGSMHYFRIPEPYWMDRLLKARAGGLNAIQTYIEWSSHQPEPDQFDFGGNLNFTKYFEQAQKAGLLVIVRLGPFIASERDNMGLPYWLASINPKMPYRSSDPTYMDYVKRWYAKMLPLLVPYLYQNGGPIIMAQVENEYGSFAGFQCDNVYMTALRDIFREHFGPQFQLFTVDGDWLSAPLCGVIEHVYPTIDYGPGSDVNKSFEIQQLYAYLGPFVNSEYYTGWFDVWSSPHSSTSVDELIKTLEQMLILNASVNFYMYHGGTSFGFMNGATSGNFHPMTTSYDYEAPIGEYGELRPKYYAIRTLIKKYLPDLVPPPSLTSKWIDTFKDHNQWIDVSGYDDDDDDHHHHLIPKPKRLEDASNITIKVDFVIDIFQMMNDSDPNGIRPIQAEIPLTFEQIWLRHGFIYYEHQIGYQPNDPDQLNIDQLHDRALVFVNGHYRQTLSRFPKITATPLSALKPGDRLGLFVENQGHACCETTPDLKGIIGNVTLGKYTLMNWLMYPFFYGHDWLLDSKAMPLIQSRTPSPSNQECKEDCSDQSLEPIDFKPAFYLGRFNLTKLPNHEVFLNVGNCGRKGVAFLNGFNLGRYWPVMGPQITLYVPKNLLKTDEENSLILFELESNQRKCFNVQLTNQHILNGTTPQNVETKLNLLYHRY